MPEHPEVHIEPHILDEVREICMALPAAEASAAFGAPTFTVRGKHFAMTRRGAEDRPSIWVKGAPGRQELVVGAFPDRYYRPPYVGRHGWIGCWLDDTAMPDWDEIEDLIVESYRLVAPKRLVKQMDSQGAQRHVSPRPIVTPSEGRRPEVDESPREALGIEGAASTQVTRSWNWLLDSCASRGDSSLRSE